jgi:hypothetical protein
MSDNDNQDRVRPASIRRCGSCRFAEPLINPDRTIDFSTKLCFYGPPIMQVVNGPTGQAQMLGLRPNMKMEDWCWRFEPRLDG